MNLNPKNINIVGIVSFFCKDTLFFRKMQGILEKCLRVREITKKAKKKGFFVVTIKIFMYFCKNKKPGVITSIE